VGSSELVTFPAQTVNNQSIELDNYTTLVATLADTSYALSFINLYDAVLVHTRPFMSVRAIVRG
jgi:hypothetical protein